MPVTKERQYRTALFEVREVDEKESYIVEGYATTWERYPLYEFDGETIFEQFSREDFAGANMDDVIFQYNHEGMVYARMSNDTLELSFDDHGLKVKADLSKTQAARDVYEAISNGLVTKMSWGFVPNAEPEFDGETKTITWHKGIKKIYDVSAVSIPANDTTEISARSACDGVIADALAECKRARDKEAERQRILLRLKLEGIVNE